MNASSRAGWRNWTVGIVAGIIALAALVAGSAFGKIHGSIDAKLIAWISAGVVLVFGVIATVRISAGLAQLVALRSVPALEGAVRILSTAIGALIVIFSVLTVLEVSIEHLLVGAGLAGVVLGIAAQQSLGNVFAGIVLILARPFGIGDHIRIRSGALGGIFDASVLEMSLTYVTLHTDDGTLKVPNSAMLAAGVGQLRREATPAASASPSAAAPVPPLPAAAPVPPASAPVPPPAPAPVPPPASVRPAPPPPPPSVQPEPASDVPSARRLGSEPSAT